jgi:type I restriction enzyme S subunit
MAHVRPPKGSEGERTKVREGDLLVTITGANVTKSAFVDRAIGEAYVNQHVALGRPILPTLTEYLHLWIVSPEHGRKKLAADAYGAGKPGLNLENLRTMPVGLPTLEEQAEIVARAKALFALADRVHDQTVAAARRVERSAQAVLAKAFRGELATIEAAQSLAR